MSSKIFPVALLLNHFSVLLDHLQCTFLDHLLMYVLVHPRSSSQETMSTTFSEIREMQILANAQHVLKKPLVSEIRDNSSQRCKHSLWPQQDHGKCDTGVSLPLDHLPSMHIFLDRFQCTFTFGQCTMHKKCTKIYHNFKTVISEFPYHWITFLQCTFFGSLSMHLHFLVNAQCTKIYLCNNVTILDLQSINVTVTM